MTQTIQWTKSVCQLDSDGIYIGQTEAELDTYARDGSYLIPGGCIDTAPPEANENQAARWTGSSWEYIPDYRGKTAYQTADGQAVMIEQVGTLPEGLTLAAPPTPSHTWDGQKWELTKSMLAEQLAQAKATKLNEINRAAEAFINQVSGGLPEFEVETWDAQAAEAKAWHADKSAATPVIDQIALGRGVDAAALRAKAYKKLTDFERLTGCHSVNEFRLRLIGRRQALEAAVNAAATAKDVAAVKVGFDLPGAAHG